MKSYEKHISRDGENTTVFWCSMNEVEKAEYVADHRSTEKTAVARMTDWNASNEPVYRFGKQGGYSIDACGFANNGIIY